MEFPDAKGASMDRMTLVNRVMEHLWSESSVPSNQGPMSKLAGFICSVARCSGRVACDRGFDYLKLLHKHLQDQLNGQADRNYVLIEVIIESSYIFAQQVSDRKHLDYAESIEVEFRGKHLKPRMTPSKIAEQDQAGFRWEEGISEWVAATPAVAAGLAKTMRDFSSDDDEFECDTPFKRPVKRKSISTVSQTLPKYESAVTAESRRNSDGARISKVESQQALSKYAAKCDRLARTESAEYNEKRFKLSFNPPKTYVDRLPRLGHRLLQLDRSWTLFDDSDDELSAVSAMESVHNTNNGDFPELSNSSDRINSSRSCRSSDDRHLGRDWEYFLLEDSQDELGI